jgi:hypothetical protein
MKRLAICFAMLGVVTLLAIPAYANLQVRVTDSLGAQVFTDAATPGVITANAADGDFTVSLHIATTNSPGGPVAQLHIDSIVQATAAGVISICPACGAGFNMKVEVSDTAFTMPLGPLGTLVQAVDTNTNPSSAATGNSAFNGYQVDGGGIFATGPNHVGPSTFASFADTNNDTQSVGGILSTSPFALTEVIQLNFTNTNQGQATANLALSQVPEPASIMFMGSIVLGLAGAYRKKLNRG